MIVAVLNVRSRYAYQCRLPLQPCWLDRVATRNPLIRMPQVVSSGRARRCAAVWAPYVP
jgi:hypothetical protein